MTTRRSATSGFGPASRKPGTAGFGGPATAPPAKPEAGWLRRNWQKAVLWGAGLLTAAAYTGEAWYHTSQSDFKDKYSIPGFVFNEVCYDVGDAGIMVSSLWSEAEDQEEHKGKFMLIRDDASLKVLFCRPRHLDNSFSEIPAPPKHKQIYEWQESYIMEQIGDKATEVGMGLSHGRYPIVHLLSEAEILKLMSHEEKQAAAKITDEKEYAQFLGQKAARDILDINFVSDHSDQKPRNSTRFYPHYVKVEQTPE